MNKRIVSFVLCLCLCMSLLAVPGMAAETTASGTCGDNLTWSMSADGVLTISGTGDMEDFSSTMPGYIPWYGAGYAESITSVDIKSGVTSITIPEGVTSIESMAFYSTGLSSVTIPDSVESIGSYAFAGALLTDVVVGDGVTSIGNNAFHNCSKLENLTLGNKVSSIGQEAFAVCNLESIVIPASVTSIGDGAFHHNPINEIAFMHESTDSLNIGGTVFQNSSAMDVTVYVTDAENVNSAISGYSWSGDRITVTYASRTIAPEVSTGYTTGISAASTTVTDGDTMTINVAVSHGEDTSFNAGEIKMSYDTAKLSFVSASSGTVKNENGVITLEDYGTDKSFGTAVYTLTFNAIASGSATVTMDSAAFADKEDAEKSDLIAAEISPAAATITIAKKVFNVTLPEGFSGAATVTDGESYTFTITDTNHTYSNVTATVGGTSVAVTKSDDGSYTVPAVSGTLEITATVTPKSYSVTIEGTAADDITDAADTATYSTDYAFTMPSAEGWAYELASITIAGVAYTGYSVADSVYTIPGTAITGEIEITVNKTRVTITVEVEGTGAGAAAGYAVSANVGEDYTLTIVPVAGYKYTVTATMGDGAATVIDNKDNTYTIENVSNDIIFTVERTVVVDGVSVSEYLTVDGTMLWLVKNATTLVEGNVATYDGSNMFWSEKYNAYCYLVITDTLSAEDAKAKVGIADGTVTNVDYGMDVNGTGKVDASDAQLVHNMYNASYGAFTEDVTMEKFLRADVNGDTAVNVEDAAAIIGSILS